MDEAVLTAWRETVGEADTIICGGDIALADYHWNPRGHAVCFRALRQGLGGLASPAPSRPAARHRAPIRPVVAPRGSSPSRGRSRIQREILVGDLACPQPSLVLGDGSRTEYDRSCFVLPWLFRQPHDPADFAHGSRAGSTIRVAPHAAREDGILPPGGSYAGKSSIAVGGTEREHSGTPTTWCASSPSTVAGYCTRAGRSSACVTRPE